MGVEELEILIRILGTSLKEDSSFLSEDDVFQDNEALGNGGALYLDWESLGAKNSQFLSNSAVNGGAIYFIHLDGGFFHRKIVEN